MRVPEPNPPRPRYVWPWFALGFVLLGIVLAIVWVWLAAKKIEQQRDNGEPVPTSSATP